MRYLMIFFIGVSLLGCDSRDSSDKTFHGPNVELAEVSSGGCLNIHKYFQILKSMPPNLPVRQITTDFEANALKDNSIGDNYKLRTAYQSFLLEDTVISKVNDLRPLTQTDCETVAYVSGATKQLYKITASSLTSLTIEDDFQERITYTWNSQNSLLIKHEFLHGDLNCDEKSEATLSVLTELAWGDPIVTRAPTIPVLKISDRFLTMLSQATNYPKDELYTGSPHQPLPEDVTLPYPDPEPTKPPETGSPPAPSLSIAKLRELSQQPLRPELLHCH